jgi:aspartate kinase
MRILVQKFGGTSVRSVRMREAAIEKVLAARSNGYAPVVVVSAMGREGEPYATDTLIRFGREAAGGELTPRENDLLMSCGEIISAVVMATAFKERGVPARAVTGWQAGIYTDDCFGNAAFYEADTARLYEMLNAGVIPVVTGFQGITRSGDVTTLGRGGSDTTAAILGSALRAEAVEIYTDVDGVMTADPRMVPEAAVISDVSYNEVFQMADHGAKVIHAKAVEIAMQGNVPLIVRNTMNDAVGTRISSCVPKAGGDQDVLSGIAYAGGRAQVKVGGMTASSEKNLFGALADAGISIDLINVFPDSLVITIDEDKTENAGEILKDMALQSEIIGGLGKVSAIGARMRGVPGVMARIIRSLSDEGVEVLQTADSHMTISCLIKAEDAQRAVRALHEEFRLARKNIS